MADFYSASAFTSQHNPVMFRVYMLKRNEAKSRGWRTIKWWEQKYNIVVEYKARVKAKSEELSQEASGEWKKYRETFMGVPDYFLWKNIGKGQNAKE